MSYLKQLWDWWKVVQVDPITIDKARRENFVQHERSNG